MLVGLKKNLLEREKCLNSWRDEDEEEQRWDEKRLSEQRVVCKWQKN